MVQTVSVLRLSSAAAKPKERLEAVLATPKAPPGAPASSWY
jgi:hypothetical protein